MDPARRKSRAAALSVASNTFLVAGKLAVGFAIGSVSVISEAIHSAVDLVAAIIAWAAVRLSARPADPCHPWGHGKWENLSGTVEAALIVAAAIWIIVEAARKLLAPGPVEHLGWGVGVMAVSAVLNQLVSSYLMKVGRETDSVALQADAWHLRTDVYTSAGVMLALAVLWLGARLLPAVDLRWVDPLAAILVALLILRAGWSLTVEAARDLLDAGLPEPEIAWISAHLASLAPEVRGFHKLRTRKAGAQRFIDVHIHVDGAMTVDASHAITDRINAAIRERLPGSVTTVHVEPAPPG